MPSATAHAPHTVQAALNYYLDPSEGGYTSFYFGTLGEKRRAFKQIPCQVEDIRGREGEFELDIHGFQYLKHESQEKDFDDVERIKGEYVSECEELVLGLTGASRTHFMGHVCRRQTWDEFRDKAKEKDDKERMPVPTTARYVHVDYSYAGAETRLEFYLPNEAATLRKKRWAILSLWRPITPITREPLAFTDARSIPDSHLRPVLAKFLPPKGTENLPSTHNRTDVETWSVAPGPGHKWYYCKNMQPDEMLLIKIFDSDRSEGMARRCPHTAFTCPEDFGPARQSFEVRLLVFWD